jgi:hypothetical protein
MGWASPWEPASPRAVIQKHVGFQGGGALHLSDTGYARRLAGPQQGRFVVEHHLLVPKDGGVIVYVRDGEEDRRDGPVWRVANGKFNVLQDGKWLDTPFAAEAGKWHKVVIAIDVSARTWEFSVDGRALQSPARLPFRAAVDRLDTVRYLCENVPGVYIGAVRVLGTAKPAEEKKTQVPVDFSLTAEAFAAEVDAGPANAAKKYGGRTVELTGRITFFTRHPLDPKGPPQIQVGQRGLDSVICYSVDRQPWRKCAPDQTIKIRGKVDGSLLQVAPTLNNCEFTVIAGEQPSAVTVAQLLKEASSDMNAARKKYDRKFVFLSGQFVSVTKGGITRTVQLQGNGPLPVTCEVSAADAPLLNSLKAGEPVTFLGEVMLTDRLELGRAVLTRASVIPE